jgi:hypothetical protein
MLTSKWPLRMKQKGKHIVPQKQENSNLVVNVVLFLIFGGVIWGIVSFLARDTPDPALVEKTALIDESIKDAKAARQVLPNDFDRQSSDDFIYHAHICSVVMSNRLEKDNWWSWTNTVTDVAPANLMKRADELGIDVSDGDTRTFFGSALAELPAQMDQHPASEGANFTFYVTTTTDTFSGLVSALREYSCQVTSFDTIWFKEKSSTLY